MRSDPMTKSSSTPSSTTDGWKEQLWSSQPWIQFHQSAKTVFENFENDTTNNMEVDCFGELFDDLFSQINTLVLEKGEEKSTSRKSSRAFLQAFSECPSECPMQLRSYSSFRESIVKGDSPSLGELLFRIQWQVRLRLALWERMGNEAFLDTWMQQVLNELPSKRRRRAKKENQGPEYSWKLCCEDLTSLVSLGLMKAVQEKQGGLKVEDVVKSLGLGLHRKQQTWRIRLLRDVWTFFDLVPDSKPRRPNLKSKQPSAVLPPLSVPEEESVKSKETVSTASTNKENGHSYFGERVRLTAPATKKTNSLLGKSARSRFVGSHFNTNLTNMSALFRSVPSHQVPVRKPTKTPERKRPAHRIQVADSPPTKINVSTSVKVNETPSPQRKRSRVVWETPEGLRRPRTLPL